MRSADPHLSRDLEGPGASALPLLLLAMCALVDCRGGTAGPSAGHSGARRYTARAEVMRLPTPGRIPAQLTVRHEAIAGFVDRSGAAVGMPAMVMAFDLAPGVSAAGLRAGDKVEFVVSVDWSRPRLQIEEVQQLPPETVLDFGPYPSR
jgi:copper binding protein CusF